MSRVSFLSKNIESAGRLSVIGVEFNSGAIWHTSRVDQNERRSAVFMLGCLEFFLPLTPKPQLAFNQRVYLFSTPRK